MIIATYLDEDIQLFQQIKRKTPGSWKFLLSGEWSQSPYHQGNVQFYVRNSNNYRNWAILSSGFPKRIVVVATSKHPTSIEDASGIMLQTLRKKDGEYFDLIDDIGDIDYKKFFEAYKRKLPSDSDLQSL